MKKYRKITNECIETRYRYMNYRNYQNERLIGHDYHRRLRHDIIIGHRIYNKPIYKIKNISD